MEEHYGKVSIRALRPMRVACYRAVSRAPEEDAHAFLRRWVAERRGKGSRPPRVFGFDTDVDEEARKAGLRGYEVWATVAPAVRPSDGVVIRRFPGGTYAVMRISDPFTKPFEVIPAGWGKLLRWVRESDRWEPFGFQCLEESVGGKGAHAEFLDLHLPVIEVAGKPRARPA